MKKLIIRALAGLLASVLLVAGVALVGNMPNGKRTDGIFYQASGIHPDAALMTVNKRSVSAEEYLYWLAYDCDYLSSYMGSVDFDAAVSGGLTTASTPWRTLSARWCSMPWCASGRRRPGSPCPRRSQAQLDAQRQQYVTYYGGEEGLCQAAGAYGGSPMKASSRSTRYTSCIPSCIRPTAPPAVPCAPR